MEMTPGRRKLIDAQVDETQARMLRHAAELNDLVRLAISCAKPSGNRVYYPMDPVNECVRQWKNLEAKVDKLAREIRADAARLGAQPFDPEAPAAEDPAQPG